jgi:Tfp pilus assembly pilus retraction ATPase PilT
MSTKDVGIAIISAVALLVTLQTLSAHKTTDRVIQAFQSMNEDKIKQALELVDEQTVLEQPVLEEPVLEEPVLEQPVLEEPVLEQPVLEQPVEQPVEQNMKSNSTCKQVTSNIGEKPHGCCDNLDDLMGYDLDQYATF